jgi:chromosome segregation ATPase
MKTPKFFKMVTVFGAIAVAATLVCFRGSSDQSGRHPLLEELGRLRVAMQRLLDRTTHQIEALDPACAKLRESEAELNSRCRVLVASDEELLQDLDDHEQVLRAYAKLVEANEGAVLPDGKYVSVETVYRQYAFEREKRRLLTETQSQRSAHRATVDQLRRATQQRLVTATKALNDLQRSREQLLQQQEHIELLVRTFSAAGLPERTVEHDVQRLQREIAAIQDQLDVQIIGLPDTIAIDPLELTENSFVHEGKVVP